jgi:hypothetical protein
MSTVNLKHHVAATERIRAALKLIESAKNALNDACSNISPVVGLGPDWRRIGKLADDVHDVWHELNMADPKGGYWKMDGLTEDGK